MNPSLFASFKRLLQSRQHCHSIEAFRSECALDSNQPITAPSRVSIWPKLSLGPGIPPILNPLVFRWSPQNVCRHAQSKRLRTKTSPQSASPELAACMSAFESDDDSGLQYLQERRARPVGTSADVDTLLLDLLREEYIFGLSTAAAQGGKVVGAKSSLHVCPFRTCSLVIQLYNHLDKYNRREGYHVCSGVKQ